MILHPLGNVIRTLSGVARSGGGAPVDPLDDPDLVEAFITPSENYAAGVFTGLGSTTLEQADEGTRPTVANERLVFDGSKNLAFGASLLALVNGLTDYTLMVCATSGGSSTRGLIEAFANSGTPVGDIGIWITGTTIVGRDRRQNVTRTATDSTTPPTALTLYCLRGTSGGAVELNVGDVKTVASGNAGAGAFATLTDGKLGDFANGGAPYTGTVAFALLVSRVLSDEERTAWAAALSDRAELGTEGVTLA